MVMAAVTLMPLIWGLIHSTLLMKITPHLLLHPSVLTRLLLRLPVPTEIRLLPIISFTMMSKAKAIIPIPTLLCRMRTRQTNRPREDIQGHRAKWNLSPMDLHPATEPRLGKARALHHLHAIRLPWPE